MNAVAEGGEEKKRLPSLGDLLLCTVKTIHPHCAFVTLNEYDGLEGMIHISEISTSWIKNIRSHVKEGKIIVCKVMRVDEEKGYINLSIRRVTEFDRREKFNAAKRATRVERMMDYISKRLGAAKSDVARIVELLGREFTEAYFAFEEAARNGPKALTEKNVPPEWAEAIAQEASKNISFPLVTLSGTLTLASPCPDGVVQLRSVLKELKNAGLSVRYISAPKYNVSVEDVDYKSAEKKLKSITDAAISKIDKLGGSGEFEQQKKK